MRSQPRVLHVIPQDGIGGVEVAARSMLREAKPEEFRLLVIAGRSSILSPAVIETGYDGINDPRAQLAAAKLINALDPHILICSLWRSVPACLLAKLRAPHRVMVMFLHLDRPVHLADRFLTWLGMKVADEIWSDSAATLAARSTPKGKRQRIVSFVTERLVAVGRPDVIAPRFVTWARLTSQKGIDLSIKLIRMLVDRGIDARFEIWGPDGGERPALERLTEELGLSDHVSFHGPATRQQLPTLAAANSFFLQLSRFEGMAIGVVEAMQLGLIPVTSGAGQMAHYVRDGITGLRIDAGRIDQAADALTRLLDAPDRALDIRMNATRYWKDAPLYAGDIEAYAIDIIDRRRARPRASRRKT